MNIPKTSSFSSIRPLHSDSITSTPTSSPAKKANKQSFVELIGDMVQDANTTHLEADNTVRELMAGNVDNVHDVVLKVAKADLSFRFLMEVRNKVTEAYQEISRMPL